MKRKFLWGLLLGIVVLWLVQRYRRQQEESWQPATAWRTPAAEPARKEKAPAPEGVAEPSEAASEPAEGEMAEIEGYCVRCRARRPIQNPEPTVTERGQHAVRGTCPVCGTTMFRFVKAT